MDNKTCGSCIYRSSQGECRCPHLKSNDYDEDGDQTEADYMLKNPDSLIATSCDEEVFLWVGPNFGCIHQRTCSIPCHQCANDLCTLRKNEKNEN